MPCVYYDIVVAHPYSTGVPTGDAGRPHVPTPTPDAALRLAEDRKRNDYRPPPGAAQVQFVPIAFDTFGRWGEAAALAMRRLARRRAERPDAIRSVRRRGIYAEVLARWRASAAVFLQRSNFDLFAECTNEAAAPTTADPDFQLLTYSRPFIEYVLSRVR